MRPRCNCLGHAMHVCWRSTPRTHHPSIYTVLRVNLIAVQYLREQRSRRCLGFLLRKGTQEFLPNTACTYTCAGEATDAFVGTCRYIYVRKASLHNCIYPCVAALRSCVPCRFGTPGPEFHPESLSLTLQRALDQGVLYTLHFVRYAFMV